MTLSLAADVLHYIPEELDTLAQHIQTMGDKLTSPIMRVYEEDIRTPIKSVIRGALIRGILVQVQKAKVCLSFFFFLGGGGGLVQELRILHGCKTYFKIPPFFPPYPPYGTNCLDYLNIYRSISTKRYSASTTYSNLNNQLSHS